MNNIEIMDKYLYKFTILTPHSFLPVNHPDALKDPVSEEFAEFLSKRVVDSLGLRNYVPHRSGEAYLNMAFDDFENQYLKKSEYLILVTSGKYAACLDVIYPRLLVFLTMRPTWRSRGIIIYIGPPEGQKRFESIIFSNPMLIFSPYKEEWASQTNQWNELLGVLKKNIPLTPIEQNYIFQHPTDHVNALNAVREFTNLNAEAQANENTPGDSTQCLINLTEMINQSKVKTEKQDSMDKKLNEMRTKILTVNCDISPNVVSIFSHQTVSNLSKNEVKNVDQSNDSNKLPIIQFKSQLVQTDSHSTYSLRNRHLNYQSTGRRIARRHSLNDMCLFSNTLRMKYCQKADTSPDGFRKRASNSHILRITNNSNQIPQVQTPSSDSDAKHKDETKHKKGKVSFFKNLRIKKKSKKDLDASFKLGKTIGALADFSHGIAAPTKQIYASKPECIQLADNNHLKTTRCQARMNDNHSIDNILFIQTSSPNKTSNMLTSPSTPKRRQDSGIMSNYSRTSTDAICSPVQSLQSYSLGLERICLSRSSPSSVDYREINSEWSSAAESPDICRTQLNHDRFGTLPVVKNRCESQNESLEELKNSLQNTINNSSANSPDSVSEEHFANLNAPLDFADMKQINANTILSEHRKPKTQEHFVKHGIPPYRNAVGVAPELIDPFKAKVSENTIERNLAVPIQTASHLIDEHDNKQNLSENDLISKSLIAETTIKPMIMNPDSHAYSESMGDQTQGDVSDNDLAAELWTDSESISPSQSILQLTEFDMDPADLEISTINGTNVYADHSLIGDDKMNQSTLSTDTGFGKSESLTGSIKPNLIKMVNSMPYQEDNGYKSFTRSFILPQESANSKINLQYLQPVQNSFYLDNIGNSMVTNFQQLNQVRDEIIDDIKTPNNIDINFIAAQVDQIIKAALKDSLGGSQLEPGYSGSATETNKQHKNGLSSAEDQDILNLIEISNKLLLEKSLFPEDLQYYNEQKDHQQAVEEQEVNNQSLLPSAVDRQYANEMNNDSFYLTNKIIERLQTNTKYSGYTETNIDLPENDTIIPIFTTVQNSSATSMSCAASIRRCEGSLMASLSPASPETMRLVRNASKSYEMYPRKTYNYENLDDDNDDEFYENERWNLDGEHSQIGKYRKSELLSFLPSSERIPEISVTLLNMSTAYLPRYVSALHNWSEGNEDRLESRNPDENLQILARNAQEFVFNHPMGVSGLLFCTTLAAPMLQQIPFTLMDFCSSGVIQESFHLASSQPGLFLSERFSDLVNIFRASPSWNAFSLMGSNGIHWHFLRPS